LEIQQFDTANPDEILITFLYVTYNAPGFPTDVITSPAADISPYDYHFRYDSYNRPTDFIINNSGSSGAAFWHRYSYPNPSTVVDTTYNNAGQIDGPPPSPAAATVVDVYRLDNQERITSAEEKKLGTGGGFSSTDYLYDRKGNLVRNGVTYDTTICLYRTNYVWMLINRDFSRNNPVSDSHLALTATEFGPNAYGLPYEFASGLVFNDKYEPGFLFNYLTMSMIYTCDGNTGVQ
jgi:hypothetical protein